MLKDSGGGGSAHQSPSSLEMEILQKKKKAIFQ